MASPTKNSPPPTPMDTTFSEPMSPTSPTSPTSPSTPAATTTPRVASMAAVPFAENDMVAREHSSPEQQTTTRVGSLEEDFYHKPAAVTLHRLKTQKSTTTTLATPSEQDLLTFARTEASKPHHGHRPRLAPVLTRLRYPLAPLHPLPTGPPHPAFPRTLLHYHLLTEPELDSLASYYHQRPSNTITSSYLAGGPPSPSSIWTDAYPANMHWDDSFLAWVGEQHGDGERVRRKRRKVGRFIGLRDCETPVEECGERERWSRNRRERGVKEGWWGRFGR